MVVNQGSGHWVITITLLAAVMLSILPMPLWAQWGRPAIVAMVLIYWVIALPEHIGIGVAWTVGLLQDIVVGTLYQRLRMFTPVQQAVVVFVLIGLNQLLCHWIQTLTGTVSPNLLFLLPALISALLWPVLSVFLRLLRRNYYVN
jgi:rod shape-determining protein MreD